MKNSIICAIIIATSIVIFGLTIRCAIYTLANKDRCITVKGLAEKEVLADKVTWPIVTTCIGNNLSQLYTEIDSKNRAVVAFLKSDGIEDSEISISPAEVNDRNAQDYGGQEAAVRYNVTSVIIVTCTRVDLVRQIMARQSELLREGIAIVKTYNNIPKYEYTAFKEIKPQMMEDAVANALTTAKKFAKQSGCKIGKMKSASQGVFTMEDRDEHTPYIKRLRVVTTLTYSLK